MNSWRKSVMTLILTVAAGLPLTAQVQTQVPPVVPGAKPLTVEHIKIHGAALEGTWRATPSTATSSFSCRRVTRKTCMVTPSAPSSGPTKSTCRKRSKALFPRAQRR